MLYPKTVKMKLHFKYIFNVIKASILSNRYMIYKLFKEMNCSVYEFKGSAREIFIINCHMSLNKLNNLDKSEISSKLKP